MTSSTITLHEAAEELGVHYMTAYRYIRTGRLPAQRDGSAWRVKRSDVKKLKDAPSPRRGRTSVTSEVWAERLAKQLVLGDESGAWKVTEDCLTSGVEPASFYTDVVVPTLHYVGKEWRLGNLSIAEEHQASGVVSRIVGRMGPMFNTRGRKRGVLVLGAPPMDWHSLPGSILSDLLRGQRFQVHSLGANVPADSFCQFVDDIQPLGIGVGATTPGNEDNIADLITRLHETAEIPVVLGGSAIVDEDRALALGADRYAATGQDAIEVFAELADTQHAAGSPTKK